MKRSAEEPLQNLEDEILNKNTPVEPAPQEGS
jgi:hypothetical protein